jgi:hypothetical protein
MSYKVNKTNGDLLVDLLDGTIDEDTTNLTLIGRNYTGFGELLNENFIKLLENFANVDAPESAIAGQVWYDTTTQKLKVYNGDKWVEAGSPFVQGETPQMVAGDLWINNSTNQFHFYDGEDLVLVGPVYTAQQGKSGFEVASIRDTQNRLRSIVNLWVAGSLTAVISNLTFTPLPGEEITGISGDVQKGINVIDNLTFKFVGIAQSAENLVTPGGEILSTDSFISAIADDVTTGALTISNINGLTIGASSNNVSKISGTNFITENQLLDHNYRIRVRSSSAGEEIVDAITVDTANARVGIFNAAPQFNLDVTGDARITGNLTVNGTTTTVNSTTVEVGDKNIELGSVDSPTDATADNGGITLKGTTDKTLSWSNSTSNWTSNQSFDLTTGNFYKINNVSVLSSTTLGSQIENSSLTSVGTLTSLNVGVTNFTAINDNVITTTGAGLEIVSDGNIQITGSKQIKGVADPTLAQDVSTKAYTDAAVLGIDVAITLDITGLTVDDTPTDAIHILLNDLYPTAGRPNGTIAKVYAVEYSFVVSDVNITVSKNNTNTGTLDYEEVNVMNTAGTGAETIMRSIAAANPAGGTVTTTITRTLKTYEISSPFGSPEWTHISNGTPSVVIV